MHSILPSTISSVSEYLLTSSFLKLQIDRQDPTFGDRVLKDIEGMALSRQGMYADNGRDDGYLDQRGHIDGSLSKGEFGRWVEGEGIRRRVQDQRTGLSPDGRSESQIEFDAFLGKF